MCNFRSALSIILMGLKRHLCVYWELFTQLFMDLCVRPYMHG